MRYNVTRSDILLSINFRTNLSHFFGSFLVGEFGLLEKEEKEASASRLVLLLEFPLFFSISSNDITNFNINKTKVFQNFPSPLFFFIRMRMKMRNAINNNNNNNMSY